MAEPGSQRQPDDPVVDLLVQQVTEGLSPAEERALDALDSPAVMAYRLDLERTVAALDLAVLEADRPLPPALRERLDQAAQSFAASAPAPAGRVVDLAAARPAPRTSASSTGTRHAAVGWWAAAACLLLAVVGWLRGPPPAPSAAVTAPAVEVPTPPALPPTPAAERAALLAEAGTLRITLAGTKDPAAAGVTGDVVWDPATQRGFLHFAGLAANDPQVHQYQIWIFDAERDKRYPVDGGVFDVPASAGEVVIPIRAVLHIGKPAAFAVTVEKPGGAVVSTRDHVVVLGAAG